MLTIVRRELKNQLGSWLVWTGSISVLLAVCIFVYPQMQEEARGLGDAFSSMGAFTKAFGMDSLDSTHWNAAMYWESAGRFTPRCAGRRSCPGKQRDTQRNFCSRSL